MDPLTPNDPLWKLLGKARPVNLRSNFTANVVRAARQTPQEIWGWPRMLGRLTEWAAGMQRPALIGAATLIVVTLAAVWLESPVAQQAPSIAAVPAASIQTVADEDMALIADDFSLQIEGLDHMEALVAMDNTSSLTDSEIAFLLY